MTTLKLITAICLLAPLTAHAQEVNLSQLGAEPNRVFVKTGAEYAFVAGVGYSHALPFLDRHLVLSAEATVPWAAFDLSDYSVRVGALVPIVGAAGWNLAGSLAPIVRGTESTISRMTNVGADLAIVGGYYTRSWFAAVEAGLDLAVSTNVTHSDDYRMTVYADAKDGWYANPGGNVRAGVQAGMAFDRYDVIVRAGQVRDVSGDPPLFPFYATVAVDSRW